MVDMEKRFVGSKIKPQTRREELGVRRSDLPFSDGAGSIYASYLGGMLV